MRIFAGAELSAGVLNTLKQHATALYAAKKYGADPRGELSHPLSSPDDTDPAALFTAFWDTTLKPHAVGLLSTELRAADPSKCSSGRYACAMSALPTSSDHPTVKTELCLQTFLKLHCKRGARSCCDGMSALLSACWAARGAATLAERWTGRRTCRTASKAR